MEFDRSELIALACELRRELKTAHERIASLEQRVEELSKRSPTTRFDESYSLKAEERRREKQHNNKRRQKSSRRERRTTQEKLDRAERAEVVCPAVCHDILDFFARELAVLSVTTFWSFLREFSPLFRAGI